MSGLGTILIGAAGTIGVILCISGEKSYRKAKKTLDSATSREVMTVEGAIKHLKQTKHKQSGYITGKAQSIDNAKVIYTESRPRYFSIWKGRLIEATDQRAVTAPSFTLNENSKSVMVRPYQETLSFGMKPSEQQCSSFMNVLGMTFLFLTSFSRFPLHLFDVNYITYDGDFITAFGTLVYNTKSGTVEMRKAKYLLNGSKTDLIKHLTSYVNKKWWITGILEVITGLAVGYFAYRGYKTYQAWRRQRIEAERVQAGAPGQMVVDDLRCAICHKEYRTVTYKNCGHLATCSKCDSTHDIKNCPICGKPVVGKSLIYLA